MSRVAIALLRLLTAVVKTLAVQVLKLLGWMIVLLVAMALAADGAGVIAAEVHRLLQGAASAQAGRQLRDTAWRWAMEQAPRLWEQSRETAAGMHGRGEVSWADWALQQAPQLAWGTWQLVTRAA